MKELITASRMSCLLNCPRKHYWEYECRLQREEASLALRFGTAWHAAMEARWQKMDYEDALNVALKTAQDFDETTVATLSGLLSGYYAHWQDDPIKELCAETEFRHPLAGSRTFDVGGKIDGLAVLHDGRLALVEHKTTSADISPESDYWIRLRSNQQINQYILAARALGWDVATVIFDVTRKPSIRVRQNETPEDFGKRLSADTAKRPDFYFARREVPILEDDLEEFSIQRLELSRMILSFRAAARKARLPHHGWPRNLTEMNCKFCEFSSFCTQNILPDLAMPPAGFRVGKQNPELDQQAEEQ